MCRNQPGEEAVGAESISAHSGQIAARYGIRIDENDPAFVVVSLSQHALAEASAKLAKRIETSSKEFEAVVERTQTRAGKYLGASEGNRSALYGTNYHRETFLPPEPLQGNWWNKFST